MNASPLGNAFGAVVAVVVVVVIEVIVAPGILPHLVASLSDELLMTKLHRFSDYDNDNDNDDAGR